MTYMPVAIDLREQFVLVVGGGADALTCLHQLEDSSCNLAVVAQSVSPNVRSWANEHAIPLLERLFCESDLTGLWEAPTLGAPRLVYAVDDSATVNEAVALQARRKGVLVASTLESIPRSGTTTTPVPCSTGEKVEVWHGARLNSVCGAETSSPQGSSHGSLSFVGAGPGDAKLLTLRALELLANAEVVIHDRLIGEGVLSFCTSDTRFIDVGKAPGRHHLEQSEINQIIIQEVASGATVVRLKGGDPSIFGRLDEELCAIREAGIDAEIVPGVTAASAAAAAIGVSLTQRGCNASVTLMTGHGANGPVDHDWREMVGSNTRSIVYMGLRSLRFMQGRLLLAGVDPSRPVTIVVHATKEEQRVIETSIRAMVDAVQGTGATGPAVIMIGYQPRVLQEIDRRTERSSAGVHVRSMS